MAAIVLAHVPVVELALVECLGHRDDKLGQLGGAWGAASILRIVGGGVPVGAWVIGWR